MNLYHNSHDKSFRFPFGAVPTNSEVTISIQLEGGLKPQGVYLRLWVKEGEILLEMQVNRESTKEDFYEVSFTTPANPGLIWYYFLIKTKTTIIYYGNNDRQLGGWGNVFFHEPPGYQITVYNSDLKVPTWFKDGIMYQIFVDRFCKGKETQGVKQKTNSYLHASWEDIPFYLMHPYKNEIAAYDFFGGNLQGVIEKLPYLQDLGINIIYFNPLFEAESNHKYDVGDYHKIDPMFGSQEDFLKLCTEAEKLGIKIILDGVFSHTGSNSKYFNQKGEYKSLGAYQSKESPYYKWYAFKEYPHVYDCWWGVETLPNVNELESSYQEFICTGENSVLNYWLQTGVKGWRLDVADELPDEFIKLIKKTIKEKDPEAILIGEVWEDASNKISYEKLREYLLGEELDSVMNYPFRNIFLNYLLNRNPAEITYLELMNLKENYPLEIFYSTMNIIGTHDIARILTVLGEAPPEYSLSKREAAFYKLSPEQRALAIKRLKLFSLIQFTFPGVPCIYYGDEAGNEGYTDPFNRTTYPWGQEDQEILSWYQKIIKIRNTYPCLRTGDWVNLKAEGDVFSYLRIIDNYHDVFTNSRANGKIIIVLNRSTEKSSSFTLNLDKWLERGRGACLLTNEKYTIENALLKVNIEPLNYKLIRLEGENA